MNAKGQEVAHICFVLEGHYWACKQLGMSFGCAVAVLLIHRLSSCLQELIRRKFKACIARYVDDFFDVSKRRVKLTAGRILSEMARLFGHGVR